MSRYHLTSLSLKPHLMINLQFTKHLTPNSASPAIRNLFNLTHYPCRDNIITSIKTCFILTRVAFVNWFTFSVCTVVLLGWKKDYYGIAGGVALNFIKTCANWSEFLRSDSAAVRSLEINRNRCTRKHSKSVGKRRENDWKTIFPTPEIKLKL